MDRGGGGLRHRARRVQEQLRHQRRRGGGAAGGPGGAGLPADAGATAERAAGAAGGEHTLTPRARQHAIVKNVTARSRIRQPVTTFAAACEVVDRGGTGGPLLPFWVIRS